LTDDTFDVFLSHNSRDKPAVIRIAEALRDRRGLKVWLDVWELPPGRPWQEALETILRTVRSAAILVGQDGLGPWEIPEMRAALNEMVRRQMPVIPVLLPGAPRSPELPFFLAQNTWVDLRDGLSEEGLDRLQWGITGRRPPLRPVPYRAVAPRLHNLPFSSLGDLLKGRDDELRNLDAGQTTAITQAQTISGLGGIGKTRLAVEYAWRSGERYEAAFFVVAESPQTLRANLAHLARPELLDLPEHGAAAAGQSLAAVLRWLREHDRWLLILDNVDTPEAQAAVMEVLPSLAAGRVLVTTRIRDWAPVVHRQLLERLAPDEAQRYLLDRTAGDRVAAGDDRELACRLADKLGGLPLALAQAAAYIAHYQTSLAGYLQAWEKERDDVLTWHDPAVMQYPASVAATWQTTFRQLCPLATAVLRLAAFLALDPIPVAIFEQGEALVAEAVGLLGEETTAAAADSDRPAEAHAVHTLKDAIASLAACSLVTRKGAGFTVHRMVQEVLRAGIPERWRGDWIERSLRLVAASCPAESDDVRTWQTWDLLRPHAVRILGFADRAGIHQPTSELMSRLALLFFSKGLAAEAEPLMRRALAIEESCFGPRHPNVASRLNNLALLLADTNRLADAEPLLRRALAIDERSCGLQHPNVARDLNNLAQLLQDTHRLAEAEPLLRRALEIDERCYGTQHPTVAVRLNNLARLLRATHRLGDAEPLIRRALQIDEDASGPQHPEIAIDLNNLAQLLQATGRLAEAEPLLRRALAIDEAACGPQHPNVAIRLNNLARLLSAAGRPADAEPLMRRALEIDERTLGAHHPDVALVLNNLALLLRDTQRPHEAEPLMRRAVGIFEGSLGVDHPKTRTARKNLTALCEVNVCEEAGVVGGGGTGSA
jgi:tetratricopeptide (TPR) repeat protein